ncbi:MAG: transcriptional regulator [SAR86 cluster bacterium]|uniref:Transcriptional regulator n=1 Tax=SAR86 cluster bacterium TaxID=2030880 RepID=A0A2A5AE42_9GAMM|nr:MAG: transcriptional regulator [SAR86 cluster bacterium]
MSAIGPLLSDYRKQNRLSQLELSMLADVSSRHISFIETGRSSPSRAMILRLADVLNLPHRDSNLLLHCGGFTPAFTALDIDCIDMEPVRQALTMILENHNPYPALVVDGGWNVLMANTAQQMMSSQLAGNTDAPPTSNLLEAVFRHDAYRPYIENWDEVASHLLRRLRKQVLAFSKPEHDALYKRLLELSPPDNWQQPNESPSDGPMLTINFNLGGQTLCMFSTLSQFGTALDTGMEELLIESYFPADDQTRKFFEQFSD